MASTPAMIRLFLLFLLTVSLPIFSDARPCKSLFVSFSVHRHPTLDSRDPFSEMAIIVDITELKSAAASSSSSDSLFRPFGDDLLRLDLPRDRAFVASQPHSLQELPLGLSYDFSSLRDRTKDILSVVVALLFGVGCGALIAATMYLAYSLCSSQFSHRSSVYDDLWEEGDFSDDNKENIKKMGYVKIPEDVAPVKSVV
ncbi:uncharacterized protein LOC111493222 [Cucurbita maxima]|uniref:Uncharacterized protein LOC111493222 n=1 Tax=Cucurbita maxima TaxID=3661 RepID=A0A6J1KD14_CUCMA|nr:uncharacterized protein LOC111493222 [Cucurbita maxima]